MSNLDQDLIFLRSENARLSLKEISQNLQKSSPRLKYNFTILEKKGLLRNPYCIFDYSYFGLLLFRVYFRGGYIEEQDKNRTLQELLSNPNLVSLYELEGEFDLVAEFSFPNPSKFNKEFKKIISGHPTLNDYKIVLNVVTHICPRRYLTDNQQIQMLFPERIVGGDRFRETFNENELAVIKTLLNFPVTRYTHLAKKADLNVKTVRTIMNNLFERHVIKGYKYILDTNALNVEKNRLFVKLHNSSLEKENALRDYFIHSGIAVQVSKIVGDWDMEIDLESFDRSKIRYLILELRQKFQDIIEKINFINFYTNYKISYLPQALFEEEKVEGKK